MQKTVRCAILAILIMGAGCHSARLETEPKDQVAMIGLEVFKLPVQERFAWGEPVYNFDRSVAYAVKWDKNSEGWAPHSVTKIEINGITDPFLSKGDIKDGDIRIIRNVSDDGTKLHVMLEYVKEEHADGDFYGMRPVIVDLSTREITNVDLLMRPTSRTFFNRFSDIFQ